MENENNPSAVSATAIEGRGPFANLALKAFKDFDKVLCETEIPAAKTAYESAHTDNRSKLLSRWKSKCMLQKAEDATNFFQSLHDYVGVFAKKDAEAIKAKINNAVEVGSTNVNAKLMTSFTALKQVKEKLDLVYDMSCDNLQKLTDSRYSDPLAELMRNYKDSTPYDDTDDAKNFSDAIKGLKKASKESYDLVDDAVEVAIKIAGINANANLASLKEPGEDMAAKIDQLQAAIIAGIAASKARRETAQTEYTASMVALATSKYEKYAKSLNFAGLSQTSKQVLSPDCKRWSHDELDKKLNEYAEKIQKNFSDKLIDFTNPVANPVVESE